MTVGTDIPALRAAEARVARTVDELCSAPGPLEAPSLLPGWTRGHVVAHLALNAAGLARLVEGVRDGVPATMYDSDEARDRDIEELAGQEALTLRDHLFEESRRLQAALAGLTDEQREARAERTPGGKVIPVGQVPRLRLVEVEVHHADLGHRYGPQHWTPDFCELVLERYQQYPGHTSAPFVAAPDDLARTWTYGAPADLRVAGPSWALAWWVTGRGNGEHLRTSDGELPRIGGI